MVNIIIQDLDPQMIEQLNHRAVINGISIDEAAKRILQNDLRSADWERSIQEIREIRASMPPQTTDSAELIREDRNRNEEIRLKDMLLDKIDSGFYTQVTKKNWEELKQMVLDRLDKKLISHEEFVRKSEEFSKRIGPIQSNSADHIRAMRDSR